MSELSGNQADKFARKFFEKGKITNKDRIIESKIAKGQMKYVLKLMEMAKEQGKQEIIERAKAYCGLIKTEDDLFKHIDRLEKCSECSKVFWDKLCPTCIREKVDLNIKEMREECIKMINKCPKIECGWSEYLCERINKEELIQKLSEVKK